jgi:two-component system, NarL family, nitrate/nitrite response regulator NarL
MVFALEDDGAVGKRRTTAPPSRAQHDDSIQNPVNTSRIHDVVLGRKLSRQVNVGRLLLPRKSSMFATMDPITVFIADAHIRLRQGLNGFLAQQEDLQVVGEATDGLQVLSGVEALQPHILLLDVRPPTMGGLEGLPNIGVRSPRTRILILADSFEEEFIMRALQHGVQGCMLKTTLPTEFGKAIRTTHAGELWGQRKLLTRVVENLRTHPAAALSPYLTSSTRRVAAQRHPPGWSNVTSQRYCTLMGGRR